LALLQGDLAAARAVLSREIPLTREHIDWLDFKKGRALEVGHRGA
jgi:hypothetical protein